VAPHLYARSLAGKGALPPFDNTNPRAFRDQVVSLASSVPAAGRFLRAEAANENQFQTLGLFAAGVVAANVAGLPRGHLHNFVLTYLASRAVYTVLYVTGDTPFLANLRTAAYMTGVGSIFTAFVTAGIQFNKVLLL